MTGPQDPTEPDDWSFPEVATPESAPVSPSSVQLPEDDVPAHDTGSDAWWRAQAEAQRKAAEHDPVYTPEPTPEPPAPAPVEPPPTVEPQVLLPEPPPAAAPAPVASSSPAPAPSPLDSDWLPPHLEIPAETPAEPAAPPAPEPVVEVPDWYQPLDTAEPPRFEHSAEPAPVEPELVDAVYEPPAPVEAAPVEAAPIWAAQQEPEPAPTPEPYERTRPATSDLPPPIEPPATRPPHEGDRVGPVRAIAGALLAVAGVALAIGALLLAGKGEPKGSPTVQAPPTHAVSAQPSTVASTAPTTSASVLPSAQPSASSVVVTPSDAASASPAAAPVLPVDVLNNSKVKGLADTAARRFRAGGWPVPLTGNYRGGVISTTTIYFAPGQEASAKRFAAQFGIPRVAARFTGLPGSGLTVVLTRDYR